MGRHGRGLALKLHVSDMLLLRWCLHAQGYAAFNWQGRACSGSKTVYYVQQVLIIKQYTRAFDLSPSEASLPDSLSQLSTHFCTHCSNTCYLNSNKHVPFSSNLGACLLLHLGLGQTGKLKNVDQLQPYLYAHIQRIIRSLS